LRYVVAFTLAVCVLAHAEADAARALEGGVNRVVAVVDKDVITFKQVLDRAADQLKALDPNLPPEEAQRAKAQAVSRALRDAIEQRLLRAEAERLVKSNKKMKELIETRLKEQLDKRRSAAGGELALRKEIEKSGVTYAEYMKRLRLRAMEDVVLYKYVFSDVSASPDEMREFYRANKPRFREPAKARYRQIFLRAGNYASREKAREMAEYLLGLLRKDRDFAALAKKYSDGPHAKDGGLWDFTRQGATVKPIDRLLFTLKKGQVGGPVETSSGFVLLKLVDLRPGRIAPFEEAQPVIEKLLRAEKRTRRYADMVRFLKKQHYVDVRQ